MGEYLNASFAILAECPPGCSLTYDDTTGDVQINAPDPAAIGNGAGGLSVALEARIRAALRKLNKDDNRGISVAQKQRKQPQAATLAESVTRGRRN